MTELNYLELGEAIKAVFLHQDKYQVNKHVPTFEIDGKYVGDFFNFTMFEWLGDGRPPLFYHVYSPYDVVSGMDGQFGVVLEGGKPILATEFSDYVRQRTGVMTSLVAEAIGMEPQNTLFVGTGRIASCALKAFKQHYPGVNQVSYLNRSGADDNFTKLAQSLGIEAKAVNIDSIGNFDLIVCHTNSKTPVLTKDFGDKIRDGALITTFVSEDFKEVDETFYNSDKARIIVDWEQTVGEAPELKAAVESGLARKEEIEVLADVLAGREKPSKSYTIYRSHGTPMQNLAVLKLLLKQ